VPTVIYFFHHSDSAPDQLLTQVAADSAVAWAPEVGEVDRQIHHLTLPNNLEKGVYPLATGMFNTACSPNRVKL